MQSRAVAISRELHEQPCAVVNIHEQSRAAGADAMVASRRELRVQSRAIASSHTRTVLRSLVPSRAVASSRLQSRVDASSRVQSHAVKYSSAVTNGREHSRTVTSSRQQSRAGAGTLERSPAAAGGRVRRVQVEGICNTRALSRAVASSH